LAQSEHRADCARNVGWTLERTLREARPAAGGCYASLCLSLALVIGFLALSSISSAIADTGDNFVAHLAGRGEVPPRDTRAQGQAIFKLNDAETALDYKLIAANIDNVVAAHIHCGTALVVGPVGVTLFGPAPPNGGRFQGILAQGTKTAPDPGNDCGWTTLQQVVTAMRSGNTYANIHTNDGVAPTNTGPGDFPGGEIRGQIR
jgi:hypothetical protein